MKKYNFVYETTNLVNGKKYIGVHTTFNLEDGYLGSGKLIQLAIKKYGVENFKRRIIEQFETYEEALKREIELITDEIVKSKEYYNLTLGGKSFYHIYSNLPEIHWNKDKTIVIDELGKYKRIDKNSEEFLEKKYRPMHYNKGNFKDEENNIYHLSLTDPLIQEKGLVGVSKGLVAMKNEKGDIFFISKEDERIRNKELVGIFTNKKHSEETKEKMRQHKGKQSGDKNSQFGTCWIYNEELKQNKKINKTEEIPNGWKLGRKLNI